MMRSSDSIVDKPGVDVEASEQKVLPRHTRSLCPECLRVIEALKEARAWDFAQVQLATNGIRFGKDPEFAARAIEAGLNLAYLQFDALSDDVYQKMRGRPLLGVKLTAIENLYAVGIRTVLVPTVAKGVNDDQLGRILQFAIEHNREIGGINWQPIAFAGRVDYEHRLALCFTVADLAREIDRQSGLIHMYRDWYPFGFVDPFARLVHYAAPDGRVYPFCSYNSGPCHRKQVEARFAVPLEQYRAARQSGSPP
jgi:uncharacterized radical SAM superfamily Fe-S cluster-containing enzyme